MNIFERDRAKGSGESESIKHLSCYCRTVGPELVQCLSLTAQTCALPPSDSLSVSDLIELCLPTHSSVLPSIDPQLCFSNHPLTESIGTLTESVGIYLSHPVPPLAFVEDLCAVAGQAMCDGKLSITDWTCKNSMSFFLFELIKFWTSVASSSSWPFLHVKLLYKLVLRMLRVG